MPNLTVTCSRHFPAWLEEHNVGLAITTYQDNKLILVGLKPDRTLSVLQRIFPRCMGLCAANGGQTLWMTSQCQIWRFENVLGEGQVANGYDRQYVPQMSFTTGDIDAHDIAVDVEQRVVFVNTLFSCLATVSPRYSFQPVWRPPFISKLAAEDRCHLNGLAMEHGQPKYVTACGRSDVADGWRDARDQGGCVIDVQSNEVMLDGMSMPHSPRVYREQLWLLDSGRGGFGIADLKKGTFESIAFCPGYARGLDFFKQWALVGISKPRHEPTFAGLPLENELQQKHATARCGVQVIDLETGDAKHWLRIDGAAQELYDVVVLPGSRRPSALGFQSDEINHNVWFEDAGRTSSWSGG